MCGHELLGNGVRNGHTMVLVIDDSNLKKFGKFLNRSWERWQKRSLTACVLQCFTHGLWHALFWFPKVSALTNAPLYASNYYPTYATTTHRFSFELWEGRTLTLWLYTPEAGHAAVELDSTVKDAVGRSELISIRVAALAGNFQVSSGGLSIPPFYGNCILPFDTQHPTASTTSYIMSIAGFACILTVNHLFGCACWLKRSIGVGGCQPCVASTASK